MSARPRLAAATIAALALLAGPAALRPSFAAKEAKDAGPAPAGVAITPVERGLKNQMKIYFLEDHRLPVVTLRLVVRAGSADEPADKAGLANLMLDVMRHGTERRDAAQVAHEVDALGGEIKVHAGRDDMSISGRFLARNWRQGLDVIADIAQNAQFRGADVEDARREVLSALAEERQHTNVVAQDHADALVYGAHPYGRPITGEGGSVTNVTREDLVRFYGQTFVANLAFLVVVGDVEPDQATRDIEALFQDWDKKQPVERPGPGLPAFDANRIRVLDGPGLTQAELRIGFAGVKRTDPDFFPLLVLNSILGGGTASSRLAQAAAGVPGGATNAVSAFDFGRDQGAFFVSAATPVQTVRPAVSAALGAVDSLRRAGPTQAEVDAAKRLLLGATPVALQGQEALAIQVATVDLFGLGPDYFDKYADRLRAVTLDDVKRVAGERLRADKLAIVCVAPADSVRHQLEAFGTPEVLDYMSPTGTVPQSKLATAVPAEAITPQALARARAVIERALRAHGGAVRLKAVKDVSTRAGVTFTTPNGPLDAQFLMAIRMPDKTRIEMNMLGQRGVQVLNGEHGYMTNGGAISDLTAEQAQSMRAGLKVQVLPLLARLAQGGSQIGWYGADVVNGDSVDVVWVFDPDATSRASFSRKTGLLVRLEQEEPAMFGMGKVQMARVYSDYRAVDGLTVPFKIERYAGGERLIVDTLADYQINRGIPDSQFLRPAR